MEWRSKKLVKRIIQGITDLIGHSVNALRRQNDPRIILRDAYGLSEGVSNTIARHLEEHTLDSFQVPDPNRLLVEQIVSVECLPT